MIQTTVALGDIKLAKIAHGLMSMTWVPVQVPDDIAFEAIKTSLDSVPPGVKMLLNGSEFYGQSTDINANLDLIARFFEKYPSYADKAFLSIKGGTLADRVFPDSSEANLTRSVNHCVAKLKGFKKIDLFEPARVDKNVPIEDAMRTLVKLQKEGKFDYIGLSECSEASLRKAHAVAPVAIVEIEISPVSYEEETRKVIAACKELGILALGYSPLGRGLLTGALQTLDQLHENDMRRRLSRFSSENFDHNLAIAQSFKNIADAKGITLGQLCLAWVSALGPHIIPLPGSSNKARTEENMAAADIKLTEEEFKQMLDVVTYNPLKGGRTIDGLESHFWLWG